MNQEPPVDIAKDIAAFLEDLRRQDVAAKTVQAHTADLVCFACWFVDATGEPFSARALTPTDLLDYKAHLRTVQHRQAATVNRRLAALRKFYLWAKATGRISVLPTDAVRGVPRGPQTPKALAKREVDHLIRAVERDGNKRNLAVVLVLRHTGIRVGELCALRLADISISERKGSLMVHSGKGDKDRSIPLNHDVRQALSAYVAVRPTSCVIPSRSRSSMRARTWRRSRVCSDTSDWRPRQFTPSPPLMTSKRLCAAWNAILRCHKRREPSAYSLYGVAPVSMNASVMWRADWA